MKTPIPLLLLLAAFTAEAFPVAPQSRSSACRRLEEGHRMVFGDMASGDDDDADFDEQVSDEDLLQEAGEWDDKIARYNTIHLTGRIGNNPEPRYFDDGKVVVNLSLAAHRKYHSLERVAEEIKSFEDEETDWYGLEIWGQTAEFAAKYVDKGARVGVIGSLQIDEWTDRESGEPRSKAKVVVRDFDLLETRTEAEARRSNRRTSFYQEEKGRDDGGVAPAGSGGFFD
jgi:single-strand DNA-binding protein